MKKNLMSKIIIIISAFILIWGSAVFAENTNTKDANKKPAETTKDTAKKTNKKKSSKKHSKKRIDIKENQGQRTLVAEKIVYVLLKDKPIAFEQKGTRKIYITTYLDFKKEMSGIKKYTIAVVDEKKKETKYNFTTERSTTMTYKEKTDIVPSKPGSFSFAIPVGIHKYSFTLTGTDADSASAYIYYYKGK